MNDQKIKVIECKKDAIIFLNQLIVLVDKRMMRFKDGIKDLENELSNYGEKTTKIKTSTFNKHQERLECLSNYLLNLFGDETKTAVSYKQFRNIVEKRAKNNNLDFRLDDLEKDICDLLSEFRDNRNWSHHIPQSLMNSQVNYMLQNEGYDKRLIELSFSQPEIYIMTWEYHEFEWLKNLYEAVSEQYKLFSKVFQRMKKDYSKLVGSSIKIVREPQLDARPYDYNKIADKSYNINTGRKS